MSKTKIRIVFYIIVTILLAGIFYFLGWNEHSPAMQFSQEWLSCARFGIYSCGCIFVFWIAFDFLYELEKWYFTFLKVLLILCGLGLILGFGGFESLDELALVGEENTFPSPWVMPIATCWFFYDALLLSVFRKAAESKWSKSLFPFLPFIVFAICYFLSVGLSYLAVIFHVPALHAYPQVIAGMLVLIIITQILLIHRNGNNTHVFQANDRYE